MALDPQKMLELGTAVQAAKLARQSAVAKENAAMQALTDANNASTKIRADMETQIQAVIRAAHADHEQALADSAKATTAVSQAQAALDAYVTPAPIAVPAAK